MKKAGVQQACVLGADGTMGTGVGFCIWSSSPADETDLVGDDGATTERRQITSTWCRMGAGWVQGVCRAVFSVPRRMPSSSEYIGRADSGAMASRSRYGRPVGGGRQDDGSRRT